MNISYAKKVGLRQLVNIIRLKKLALQATSEHSICKKGSLGRLVNISYAKKLSSPQLVNIAWTKNLGSQTTSESLKGKKT